MLFRTFGLGNFNNCQSFAQRVCEQGDPMSAWIWGKVNVTSQTTLDLLRNGSVVTELQKKELAKDFNALMAAPDIYDETRFADIELRSETERLVRKSIAEGRERSCI